MNTIMILANNDVGLYNFRKELIEVLLKSEKSEVNEITGIFVKTNRIAS